MLEETFPTWASYPRWAQETIGARFDKYDGLLHTSNMQAIRAAAENEQFFRELSMILGDAERDFRAEKHARLFPNPHPNLDLVGKEYSSACEKSYRLNVLRNENFPRAPEGGWVLPSCWYSQLNDLVRGTLVCSYMDALPWLAAKLQGEATKRRLSMSFNPEVRDEGYYAFHLYVTVRLNLDTRDGEEIVKKPFDVSIEIQLATQLQDALRDVTHFFYEKRRIEGLPPEWKWGHSDPQFRASYMSHTLHLIDALTVELRNRVAHEREAEAAFKGDPKEPLSPKIKDGEL